MKVIASSSYTGVCAIQLNRWVATIRILALIFFLTSTKSAIGQGSHPVTTEGLSAQAALGMHLSAKHGLQSGKVSKARAECILAVRPSAFHSVTTKLLERFLMANDLNVAESFFSSSAGRKYFQTGYLQTYLAVGEPLPEPTPVFTDAEKKEIEAFASTSAGQILIWRNVMNSQQARDAYNQRIREVISECPQ